VNFWADSGAGRIVHRSVKQYEDGDGGAWMLSLNAWQDGQGTTLMNEWRRTAVEPLENGEWLMSIDLRLEAPPGKPVTLGQTPFGLIGVRMAKTIGADDGGGRILNSQGQLNEAEVFRRPARWVDYSGPVTIEPEQPLRLRYGLWMHGGVPGAAQIERHWSKFAATQLSAIP